MDATFEEICMGAAVDVTCIYIYIYIYICKYILDFNIRDTCISIMECSEIERRTILVEEVVRIGSRGYSNSYNIFNLQVIIIHFSLSNP
jgi:hypothetical protein